MSLSSSHVRITLLAILSATTFYCFWKSRRLRRQKFSLPTNPKSNSSSCSCSSSKGKLLFVSQTGTSKTLARRLFDLLKSNNFKFDFVNAKDYEPEDLHKESLVLIVASTWEDGKPPPNAGFFANWLSESADDFRVGSLLLSKCKFAVFGVGSKSYGDTYNAVAKDFSTRLRALGAHEVLSVGEGDVDGGDLDDVFDGWSMKLIKVLRGELGKCNGVNGFGDENGRMIDGYDEEDYDDDDDDEEEENGTNSDIVDLEDIGGKGPSRKSVNGVVANNGEREKNGEKEMVTPIIRANLEKQFPERIKMLNPVTQDSLKALQEKQQRTVYRLTLVKGWNTEDVDAYYNLFNVGKPDFIEIKGVTYCGS
ncbi:Flavodoxin/nitric oxide synthase [Dillenia turbinata]|uniref:Flavodoxin/nitric oxide synthase n=1 Tax=Dillenia turbinata TaxID=194707 RepID=A0AAN8VSM8_9MAGN